MCDLNSDGQSSVSLFIIFLLHLLMGVSMPQHAWEEVGGQLWRVSSLRPRNRTQVPALGSKLLYVLTHLASRVVS